MTNEKFQEIVLSELSDLKEGQKRLEERQAKFEKKIDIVYEQTVTLTEYYTDTNNKLDNIHNDLKSIHEMLGEHEVSIRTLRRRDFEQSKEYYDAKAREKIPIDRLK